MGVVVALQVLTVLGAASTGLAGSASVVGHPAGMAFAAPPDRLRVTSGPLASLPNGSGWENVTTGAGGGLPPTSLGAMVYDPVISADVLIPGTNASTCTYLYSNSKWACTDRGGWASPLLAPSLAWDNTTRQVIEFGGENPYSHAATDFTARFAAGAWSYVTTGTRPPARWGAMTAWDPADNYLVMFGGTNGTADFNDTWEYNGTNWLQLYPGVSPPARYGGVLVGDPALNCVVLFGGNSTAGTALSDTWTFQDGGWHRVATSSGPAARVDPYGAYDAPIRSVVLFGGVNTTGGMDQGTWYFQNGAWIGSSILTYPTPSARGLGEMAPSPTGNGLLLFGGVSGRQYLNDTWLFYTISPTIFAQLVHGEGPIEVNFTGGASGGVAPLQFQWAFGDGTAGYGPNVSHAFPSPGVYDVELVVTDAYAVQGRSNVTITDVADLGFSATITPALGFAPLHVQGTATPATGAPPYTITWHFGGGPTLLGTSPAYTYTTPGIYPVAVWCNDTFGRSIEQTFTVDVLALQRTPALNVTLLASRTMAVAPATIAFTAGATDEVAVLGYTWQFGDGTGANGANVSHQFSDVGRFEVSVTALDALGSTAMASLEVTIAPTFIVSVNDTIAAGPTGDLVGLRASGSGGVTPYQFFWQFGNGTGAEGANATAFAARSGLLDGQLEAVDAIGDVAVNNFSFSVPGPLPPTPPPPAVLGTSLGTVAVLVAAAALGTAGGALAATWATRAPAPPPVTRGRNGRARPGPPATGSPSPSTARRPTPPRSRPGRNGVERRRPPPSG